MVTDFQNEKRDKALEYLDNKKYQEAIELLESLLSEGVADAGVDLANVYWQFYKDKINYEKALEYVNKAELLESENLRVLYTKGAILLNCFKDKKGVDYLERLLSITHDDRTSIGATYALLVHYFPQIRDIRIDWIRLKAIDSKTNFDIENDKKEKLRVLLNIVLESKVEIQKGDNSTIRNIMNLIYSLIQMIGLGVIENDKYAHYTDSLFSIARKYEKLLNDTDKKCYIPMKALAYHFMEYYDFEYDTLCKNNDLVCDYHRLYLIWAKYVDKSSDLDSYISLANKVKSALIKNKEKYSVALGRFYMWAWDGVLTYKNGKNVIARELFETEAKNGNKHANDCLQLLDKYEKDILELKKDLSNSIVNDLKCWSPESKRLEDLYPFDKEIMTFNGMKADENGVHIENGIPSSGGIIFGEYKNTVVDVRYEDIQSVVIVDRSLWDNGYIEIKCAANNYVMPSATSKEYNVAINNNPYSVGFASLKGYMAAELIKKFIEIRVLLHKNNMVSNNEIISAADEIKKYKELLDIGAITEEEYAKKKKELLGF